MKRLDPKSTLVLVVDVQEKLAAAMPEASMQALLRAATILTEAASALGAPVLATEQYPQGLGHTVPALAERLALTKAPILEKVEFSAVEAPGFSAAWEARRPRAVVVVGMETHVCVYQTVRELVPHHARDLPARGGLRVPDGARARAARHRGARPDRRRRVSAG